MASRIRVCWGNNQHHSVATRRGGAWEFTVGPSACFYVQLARSCSGNLQAFGSDLKTNLRSQKPPSLLLLALDTCIKTWRALAKQLVTLAFSLFVPAELHVSLCHRVLYPGTRFAGFRMGLAGVDKKCLRAPRLSPFPLPGGLPPLLRVPHLAMRATLLREQSLQR